MSEGIVESTKGTERKNSVFDGHQRHKSMLNRKHTPVLDKIEGAALAPSATNRESVMTPEHNSRQAAMTQGKINEFRRRLKSQHAGRNPRIRNAELDLPNNMGGFQIGFISNGISEVEMNKHADGVEQKHRVSHSTRNNFLNF